LKFCFFREVLGEGNWRQQANLFCKLAATATVPLAAAEKIFKLKFVKNLLRVAMVDFD